ncbi:MAG TPA: hypothetical protein VGK58_02125 [Lacipirellulaceae bacterium]
MVRCVRFSTVAAALWLTSTCASPVEAAGYWNVPSNFWQCAGCSCGGGYHAPLVLGPMSWHGWCSKNHYRLPYPPAPGYGCRHCDAGFEQPAIMEPMPQPAIAPVAPAAQMRRPLFLR